MRRRHSGFSLIEVLVSVVVVSVGALSVASLQLVSKRAVRDASQRLEATQMAYSLLSRLHANNSETALQAYVATASPFLGLGRLSGPDEPVPSPLCIEGAACTPQQLAVSELYSWERFLDGVSEQISGTDVGGLVYPTACLMPPSAGAGQAGNYTVVVAYRGSASLPSDETIACGADMAFDDGTRLYGENDEFRRLVVVQSFIAPAIPQAVAK